MKLARPGGAKIPESTEGKGISERSIARARSADFAGSCCPLRRQSWKPLDSIDLSILCRESVVARAWSFNRRDVPSSERVFGMLVQATDSLAVESLLLDFELSSIKELQWQLFDCKSNRFCGLCEAPVPHRPVALAATRREQLGGGIKVKSLTLYHLRSDLAGISQVRTRISP
jgi:hypothetical protein